MILAKSKKTIRKTRGLLFLLYMVHCESSLRHLGNLASGCLLLPRTHASMLFRHASLAAISVRFCPVPVLLLQFPAVCYLGD